MTLKTRIALSEDHVSRTMNFTIVEETRPRTKVPDGKRYQPEQIWLGLQWDARRKEWEPVLLQMSGPNILRDGTLGARTVEESFISRPGQLLSKTPEWLAEWLHAQVESHNTVRVMNRPIDPDTGRVRSEDKVTITKAKPLVKKADKPKRRLRRKMTDAEKRTYGIADHTARALGNGGTVTQ